MTDAVQLERLIDAIKPIVDRHAESKAGSGLLYVPLEPREMKMLRSAYEPFRERSSSPKLGKHGWPTDGWTPGREITDAQLEAACGVDFVFDQHDPRVDPKAAWGMLGEQYKPAIRARVRAVLEAGRNA